MEIFLIIASTLIIVLVVAVVYLLKRDEVRKTTSDRQSRDTQRKLYQTRVLQEISNKIGYSLSVKAVVETTVASLEHLYAISTVSYALIDNREIRFHSILNEPVGEKYMKRIQDITLSALTVLSDSTKGYPVSVTEQKNESKSYSALHFDPVPESYFCVPVVVNNQCHGVITISSRNKDAFTEEDMDIVYEVVAQATTATQQLEAMIQSESNRLINLVSSLAIPAILFSKEDKITVSAANPIAIQTLKLPDNPSFDDVLVSVEGQIDLPTLVEEVYKGKVSVFLKNIVLKNKTFKIYLNPVFNPQDAAVIGVTMSLLNVTLEVESEKVREKFTNMVVHELRAPLTSIKGGAGLLLHGTVKGEEATKMLKIIADSSERMLSQINDLLDAAKLESGKFAIAPEVSDINELVKAKVEAFSYIAETKKITLTSEVDTALKPFVFDKMRIDQVITNLISNSLKFTEANGHIKVVTSQDNNEVTVSVTDDGMGVPAGKQNLLFVPFTQMQAAFRRDGTGLGLYISRGIVESHGGKITMKSTEGKGTTVSFTLPTNIKPIEQVTASSTQSPLILSKVNIVN